jgi:hypothetical protein
VEQIERIIFCTNKGILFTLLINLSKRENKKKTDDGKWNLEWTA